MKKQLHLFKYLLLMIMTLSLLQGCQALDAQKKNNSLDTVLRLYNESLHWEEWATAMSLYKPEPGQDDALPDSQNQNMQMFENIDVTEVKKAAVTINPEQTRAQTSIVIEYHLSNSNKIKKIHHPMTWWYNEEYKTWHTSTPLPDFK